MDSVNSKNVFFIVLFLLILGSIFGVVRFIGKTDHSSMYTELFYRDE